MKSMNQTLETSFIPTSKFLKSAGASQEISLVRDSANSKVRIDLIGDTNGVTNFDGQIIQEQGNGIDDNRGTMTIQSGGLAINTLSAGINIQATTSALIQTGSTLTLTSGAETEINCDAFDVNATGNITMDGQAISITASGAGNDITITAADDLIIASNQITMTNSVVAATSFIHNSVTTGTDLSLENNTKGSYLMRLSQSGGATAGLTLQGVNNGINTIKSNGAASNLKLESQNTITTTSVGLTTIDTVGLDINAGAGNVTCDTTGDLSLTGGDVYITSTGSANGTIQIVSNETLLLSAPNETMTLTAALDIILNCDVLDISAASSTMLDSGAITINSNFTNINALNDITLDATANIFIQAGTQVEVVGDFSIQQSTYPPTVNTMLGYTDTQTTTTNPMTNTLAERSNFDLPSTGVWLIICGYEFSSNAVNTIELKQVVLSLTSASATAAAYGLAYFEQIDDAAPSAQVRQRGTITGVVSVGIAPETIYVNARSAVNSGTNTKLITNVSWTRIG
jgi:hypothetical protein